MVNIGSWSTHFTFCICLFHLWRTKYDNIVQYRVHSLPKSVWPNG